MDLEYAFSGIRVDCASASVPVQSAAFSPGNFTIHPSIHLVLGSGRLLALESAVDSLHSLIG